MTGLTFTKDSRGMYVASYDSTGLLTCLYLNRREEGPLTVEVTAHPSMSPCGQYACGDAPTNVCLKLKYPEHTIVTVTSGTPVDKAYYDTVSGYVTEEDLEETLEGYVTVTAMSTALAAKQDTLVSGTNIKTVNNESLLGSGNLSLNTLPDVSASDNGKILIVSDGAWAAESIPVADTTLY